MSATADAAVPVPTAAFTLAELERLISWSRERRMEVWVDYAGADYADEVAYIGYAPGIASFTVHREGGVVRLALTADRGGVSICPGWQIKVGSVADALALIVLNVLDG